MDKRLSLNELKEKARQQRQQAARSYKESQKVDIDVMLNRSYAAPLHNSAQLFIKPPEPVLATSDPLSSLISSTLGDYNSVSSNITKGSYRYSSDYILPTTPVSVRDKRPSFPSQDHNANENSVPSTTTENYVNSKAESKHLTVDSRSSQPEASSKVPSGTAATGGSSIAVQPATNGRTLLKAENRVGSVWKKFEKDNSSDGLVRRRLHADNGLKSTSNDPGSNLSTALTEPNIELIFKEMCDPLPPLITAIESPAAKSENGVDASDDGSPLSVQDDHVAPLSNSSHHTASSRGSASFNQQSPTSPSPSSSVSRQTDAEDESVASPQEKLLTEVARTLESKVLEESRAFSAIDAIGYVSSSSESGSPERKVGNDGDGSSYDGISSAHDDYSGLSESDDDDLDDATKLKLSKGLVKPPVKVGSVSEPTAKKKPAKVSGSAETKVNTGKLENENNDAGNNLMKKGKSNTNKRKKELEPVNAFKTVKKTFKSADFIPTDSSSDEESVHIKSKPSIIKSSNLGVGSVEVSTNGKTANGNTAECRLADTGLDEATTRTVVCDGVSFDSDVDDKPCVRLLINEGRAATLDSVEGEKTSSTSVPKPPEYSQETLNRLMGLDSTKLLPKAKIPKKRAAVDAPEAVQQSKRPTMDRYHDDRRNYDDHQRDSYRGRGGAYCHDARRGGYDDRRRGFNDRHRSDGYHADHRGHQSPDKLSSVSSQSSVGAIEPLMSRQVAYDDVMSDVGEDAEYEPPVLGATISGLDDTLIPPATDNVKDEAIDDKAKPSYKKIGSQWGAMVTAMNDAPTEGNAYIVQQWQRRNCNAESNDSLDRSYRRRERKNDRFNARSRGGQLSRSRDRSPRDRGNGDHAISDRSVSLERNENGSSDADRYRSNRRSGGTGYQRHRAKTAETQTDDIDGLNAAQARSDRNDRDAKELEKKDAEVQTEKRSVLPTEPKLDSVSYHQEARSLKHKGDASTDQYEKFLYYLDAILSFIRQAEASMDKQSRENSSIDKILTETLTFSKSVFTKIHNGTMKVEGRRWKIAISLSYRVQAFIYYQIFLIRKSEAVKAKTTIDEACTAKSTTEGQGGKIIPSVRRYVNSLDNLLRSHQVHDRAQCMSAEHSDFFDGVNWRFGELHTDSSAAKLTAYVKYCLRSLWSQTA